MIYKNITNRIVIQLNTYGGVFVRHAIYATC